jgi:hypothetical protein
VLLEQAEQVRARIASNGRRILDHRRVHGAGVGLMIFLPMVGITEQAHADGYLARSPAFRAPSNRSPGGTDRHRGRPRAGRPARRLHRRLPGPLPRHTASPIRCAGPRRRPDADVDGAAFTAERDRILADTVRPAVAAYREVLASEVRPHGRPVDKPGLCWLPGGEEIYAT